MYENGEYTPITYDEYLENLVYIITHINPKVIVHRISADPPKDLLVAPEWCLHKKWVTNNIDKLLEENRIEDCKRIAKDPEFCQHLMEEFGIE